MVLNRAIDVTSDQRRALISLLSRHLPNAESWIYGSRIRGTSRPESDLDMVVFAAPEQARAVSDLRECLEESNLPFRVDLFVWDELPESFRDQIRREHHVLVSPQVSVNTEWNDIAFSEAVRLNPKVKLERGAEYPFIDMAAISPGFRSACATHSRNFSGGGSRFQTGDTLMARITPCLENGKVARYFSDDEFGVAHGSTEFIVIRGRPDVSDTEFAYYLTRWNYVRDYAVEQMTGTSGRQRVPTEAFDQLRVSIPPLPEQRAIAEVLGALDDKIDLNRRMNETLEAMARAIFKDWFVDFGPTRAKAEGRAPYLAPELWDLFPDTLDGEDKPVGWRTFVLSELAHHHRAALSPGARPDNIFEHYSIPAYDAGGEPACDIGSSIKSNKTIVPEDAILLSKLNPEIERVWLPNPKRETHQVASTEFLALTPRPPASRSVLYCLFKCPEFRRDIAAMVTGTSKSHQRVPPKALLARKVLVAEPLLLNSFDQIVQPFTDRILSNRREARTLSQTRDLLLPNLMSGEIRLSQAEKLQEGAA